MLGNEPGVIVKHKGLVFQHQAGVRLAENRETLNPAVGQIGEIIDQARNQDKEKQTERNIPQEGSGGQRPLLPGGKDKSPDPVPDPQQSQPGAGIKADPLAGDPEAKAEPAQGQIRRTVIRKPAIHETVHQQDKQHGEAVDGGDARLGVVQEAGGQQHRAQQRDPPSAEEALQEDIHDRQHQNAGQGPGKTPAKGRHAEKKNAQGQEFLPERRMRKLVRPDIMKMLPRGAGVVNLVKIAGIVIGLLLRDEVPLVMQVFLAAGKGDALARPVKKDQFPEPGRTGQPAKAQISCGRIQLQIHRVPLEDGNMVLPEGSNGKPALLIF